MTCSEKTLEMYSTIIFWDVRSIESSIQSSWNIVCIPYISSYWVFNSSQPSKCGITVKTLFIYQLESEHWLYWDKGFNISDDSYLTELMLMNSLGQHFSGHDFSDGSWLVFQGSWPVWERGREFNHSFNFNSDLLLQATNGIE